MITEWTGCPLGLGPTVRHSVLQLKPPTDRLGPRSNAGVLVLNDDDDILSRNWFVLAAAPGREHDAADLLRDRGAQVFMPMHMRQHRPNHHSKRRWTYWQPLLGRYLLAGFDQAVPPWLDILEHSSIAGAVDYRPVRRKSMLKLLLDYGPAGLERPARRRARTSTEDVVPGCDALVLSGPYFGKTVKVQELRRARHGKGRASVLLPILNSEHVVELALEDLEMEVAA